ncbi:hypothetical protein EDB83DRAFT_2322581 [Lactarius deliciosus]|nr:hypothetical protein EDB83DRAFT_2322581 [Lactarius deliciosus]
MWRRRVVMPNSVHLSHLCKIELTKATLQKDYPVLVDEGCLTMTKNTVLSANVSTIPNKRTCKLWAAFKTSPNTSNSIGKPRIIVCQTPSLLFDIVSFSNPYHDNHDDYDIHDDGSNCNKVIMVAAEQCGRWRQAW